MRNELECLKVAQAHATELGKLKRAVERSEHDRQPIEELRKDQEEKAGEECV